MWNVSFNYYYLRVLALASAIVAKAVILDFELDMGAIPEDSTASTRMYNTNLLSASLQFNASSNTIYIPKKTFFLEHGVYASFVQNSTIQIDGVLKFVRSNNEKTILNEYGMVVPCIFIEDSHGITLTSSASYTSSDRGIIDGGGQSWWGVPFWGYAQLGENRPNLFVTNRTKDMLIENVIFLDSPMYTLQISDTNGLLIRHISIVARRTDEYGHDIIDLSAFNTDGIDVSGHNVHIHDVDIWNQDDCIAVKDNMFGVSSNMTFERIYASGLGLVIGSIGGSTVKNITFRDSIVYNSLKGIYLKFRVSKYDDHKHGLIEDILFENITIQEPTQFGIWIGPAQQSISSNVCKAHPCSLCWPMTPFASCLGNKFSQFKNITLRNVQIINPKGSPGVILADESNPIDGITFDSVAVINNLTNVGVSESFHSLFLGLYQPVHDRYIPIFFLIIFFTLFILLLFGLLSCYFRARKKSHQIDGSCCSRRDDGLDNEEYGTNGKSFLFQKKHIIFVFLVVFILFWLHWSLLMYAKLKDENQYFKCSGVKNGIATGTSWPVPSCFEDQTSSTNLSHLHRISNEVVFMFVEGMLIFSFLIILTTIKNECHSTAQNHPYSSLSRNNVKNLRPLYKIEKTASGQRQRKYTEDVL